MLCFRKLLVANKIMDKRGTGGYQEFSSKVFCTTMSKNFRKGSLLCCVPGNIRQRKRLWIRKGDIKFFRPKDFCLRVPKVSCGKISMPCFRKLPVARNSMDKRRGYQDFPSKVFCASTPKTLAREPFCVVFQKTSGIERDYS